ncbi:MAG: DUF927 domain-containing protein [Pseudomonadota bacterium]
MSRRNNAPVSIDTARAALTFIPADERDLWLRIGMALKSEFGEGGFELFESWSEGAASFDAKDVKAVWKSFKAGAVTIATMIAEAKAHGFNPKDYAPAVPLSAVEKARITQERIEREKLAAAEKADKQSAASAQALAQWAAASELGTSAYLVRKGVEGFGVRYGGNAGSVLLVPLVDSAGKLWSLQEIFSDGRKKFLAGGRVSGCFHMIGNVHASSHILIAEGYATAATLHHASCHAVAVAFDEANIKHVAAAMRILYPSATLLICADDDSQTEEKTGKNPGVVAAMAAAKSVQGLWCKPVGLPIGKTDFNDLAASSDLDAVRVQIAAALAVETSQSTMTVKDATDNFQTPETLPAFAPGSAANGGETHETSATALKPSNQSTDKGRRNKSASATAKAGGDMQSSRPFFTVNEGGVWFHGFSQQGDPLPAQWICSQLHISGTSRDTDNDDWGYLVTFNDPDGNPKQWVIPSSMFCGDGVEIRRRLLGMGLKISTNMHARNRLAEYIQNEKVDVRVRCTDRIGWHEDVYVLPTKTIGESDERVVFQSPNGVVSNFKQRGTLDQWKGSVAAHCRGNSRMLFCVSAAFAAPLLYPARVPSGGFHIWGDSSSGKSTAFKVAGSVYGGKDYPRNWRMTDNALETVAAQHSDALLLLDEIAQVDPKVVGDTVYMLANETGKGRATQTATARKVASWRVLFLSDGEISLANHMEQAGKGTKAGHDVRMAHIAADAGKGFGVYETLHDFANGAALSDHLANMAHQYYGVAGMAFIEYAVQHAAKMSAWLVKEIGELARTMCPMDSHGQVARVAARFALVGVAGELATHAGITGWDGGEAKAAAHTCFNAWLEGRGGAGNVEHTSILRQVSGFFQAHGEARFVWWHRAMDDHKPNTINRAGFKRMLTSGGTAINSNADHHKEFGDRVHPTDAEESETEYFVLPEVFKSEICKGFNPKTVTQLLIKYDLLTIEGKGDKASATRKERLPGLGHVRCYRFKPGIIGVEA